MDGWTAVRVLDLAPDPSSRKAGHSLGRAGAWLSLGRDGALAWGEIKGSGAAPYRAALTLDGPAFRCTCPSRKFPCKHGLGLFLVLVGAEAAVAPASVPDWVAEWAAKRGAGSKPTPGTDATATATATATAGAGDAAPAAKPVDAKAQDKRRRQREAKVAAGVDELDLWLRDLVRRGLAGARGEPYAFWDRMGARLVDAQAPGLARRVRALPGLLAGGQGAADGDAVLALGRLVLLVRGWRRQAALDDALRAEVRAAIGFAPGAEESAASPGVEDHWTVLAQTVEDEEALRVRSTWLAAAGGRVAQVLDFSAGERSFPPAPGPGHAFRGEVVFHPGAAGLRAAIRGGERAEPRPFAGAVGIGAALDGVADALARVPWLEGWPMLLGGVRFARAGAGFAATDAGGALPLAGGEAVVPFLSVAGGAAVDLFGWWDGRALRPLALGARGRLYAPPAGGTVLRRAA